MGNKLVKRNSSNLPMVSDFFENWMSGFWDNWVDSFSNLNSYVCNMKKFNPNIDVKRNDNQLSVKVELPGLKKEDFSVEFRDGCLIISGEKKTTTETENKEEGYFSREISYGSFSRSIPIDPEELAENAIDNIQAVLKNGVLEISVPTKKNKQKENSVSKIVEIKEG